MNAYEKFLERRPIMCPECGGKILMIEDGKYKCEECKKEILDDYGKVRKFLNENGPTPEYEVSQKTGVDQQVVHLFLRKGRLEIPNNSRIFIKCKKCGCSIRYGSYCMDCMKQTVGALAAAFHEDAGERPTNEPHREEGRMHFVKSLWEED